MLLFLPRLLFVVCALSSASYYDDFETASSSLYSPVQLTGSTSWVLESGALYARNNPASSQPSSIFLVNQGPFGSAFFRTVFYGYPDTMSTAPHAGIAFCYQDTSNYWFLKVSVNNSVVSLHQVSSGTETLMWSTYIKFYGVCTTSPPCGSFGKTITETIALATNTTSHIHIGAAVSATGKITANVSTVSYDTGVQLSGPCSGYFGPYASGYSGVKFSWLRAHVVGVSTSQLIVGKRSNYQLAAPQASCAATCDGSACLPWTNLGTDTAPSLDAMEALQSCTPQLSCSDSRSAPLPGLPGVAYTGLWGSLNGNTCCGWVWNTWDCSAIPQDTQPGGSRRLCNCAARPTWVAPANLTITEHTNYTFSTSSLSVYTPNTSLEVYATFSVSLGNLSLVTTTGLRFSYGGQNSASFGVFATVANLNRALLGAKFIFSTQSNATAVFNMYVTDQYNSGSVRFPQTSQRIELASTSSGTISIVAENDPPVFSAPSSLLVDPEETIVFNASRAIVVADPDVGSNLEVTVAAENGTIWLNTMSGLTTLAGSQGESLITVRGSPSSITSALTGMVFTPEAMFGGISRIYLGASDKGYSGIGGEQTASSVIKLTTKGLHLWVNASAGDVSETFTVRVQIRNHRQALATTVSPTVYIWLHWTSTYGVLTQGSSPGSPVGVFTAFADKGEAVFYNMKLDRPGGAFVVGATTDNANIVDAFSLPFTVSAWVEWCTLPPVSFDVGETFAVRARVVDATGKDVILGLANSTVALALAAGPTASLLGGNGAEPILRTAAVECSGRTYSTLTATLSGTNSVTPTRLRAPTPTVTLSGTYGNVSIASKTPSATATYAYPAARTMTQTLSVTPSPTVTRTTADTPSATPTPTRTTATASLTPTRTLPPLRDRYQSTISWTSVAVNQPGVKYRLGLSGPVWLRWNASAAFQALGKLAVTTPANFAVGDYATVNVTFLTLKGQPIALRFPTLFAIRLHPDSPTNGSLVGTSLRATPSGAGLLQFNFTISMPAPGYKIIISAPNGAYYAVISNSFTARAWLTFTTQPNSTAVFQPLFAVIGVRDSLGTILSVSLSSTLLVSAIGNNVLDGGETSLSNTAVAVIDKLTLTSPTTRCAIFVYSDDPSLYPATSTVFSQTAAFVVEVPAFAIAKEQIPVQVRAVGYNDTPIFNMTTNFVITSARPASFIVYPTGETNGTVVMSSGATVYVRANRPVTDAALLVKPTDNTAIAMAMSNLIQIGGTLVVKSILPSPIIAKRPDVAITVWVTDAEGGVVTDTIATVTISPTPIGSFVLHGITQATVIQGVAQFANLSFHPTGTKNLSVTVNVPTIQNITSPAFDVRANVTWALQPPAYVPAGTAFPVGCSAVDYASSTLTDESSAVSVESTTNVTGILIGNFVSGWFNSTLTAPLQLGTAYLKCMSVARYFDPSISTPFVIYAPLLVKFEGQPTSGTMEIMVNQPFTVLVYALDTSGRPIPVYGPVLRLSASFAFSGPTNCSLVDGLCRFENITIPYPALSLSLTVIGTEATVPAPYGSSNWATPAVNVRAQLSITNPPAAVVAAETFSVTVTILDYYNVAFALPDPVRVTVRPVVRLSEIPNPARAELLASYGPFLSAVVSRLHPAAVDSSGNIIIGAALPLAALIGTSDLGLASGAAVFNFTSAVQDAPYLFRADILGDSSVLTAFTTVPLRITAVLSFVTAPTLVLLPNTFVVQLRVADATNTTITADSSTVLRLYFSTDSGPGSLYNNTCRMDRGICTMPEVYADQPGLGFVLLAAADNTPLIDNTTAPDALDVKGVRLHFFAVPDDAQFGEFSVTIAIWNTLDQPVSSVRPLVVLDLLPDTNPVGELVRFDGELTEQASDGQVTFSRLVITAPGEGYVLRAVAAHPAITSDLAVAFDKPAILEFVPSSAPIVALNTPFTVTLMLSDGNGRIFANATDLVQLSLSGGTAPASLQGITTRQLSGGYVTFTDVVVPAAGTRFRLRASPYNRLYSDALSPRFDVLPAFSITSIDGIYADDTGSLGVPNEELQSRGSVAFAVIGTSLNRGWISLQRNPDCAVIDTSNDGRPLALQNINSDGTTAVLIVPATLGLTTDIVYELCTAVSDSSPSNDQLRYRPAHISLVITGPPQIYTIYGHEVREFVAASTTAADSKLRTQQFITVAALNNDLALPTSADIYPANPAQRVFEGIATALGPLTTPAVAREPQGFPVYPGKPMPLTGLNFWHVWVSFQRPVCGAALGTLDASAPILITNISRGLKASDPDSAILFVPIDLHLRPGYSFRLCYAFSRSSPLRGAFANNSVPLVEFRIAMDPTFGSIGGLTPGLQAILVMRPDNYTNVGWNDYPLVGSFLQREVWLVLVRALTLTTPACPSSATDVFSQAYFVPLKDVALGSLAVASFRLQHNLALHQSDVYHVCYALFPMLPDNTAVFYGDTNVDVVWQGNPIFDAIDGDNPWHFVTTSELQDPSVSYTVLGWNFWDVWVAMAPLDTSCTQLLFSTYSTPLRLTSILRMGLKNLTATVTPARPQDWKFSQYPFCWAYNYTAAPPKDNFTHHYSGIGLRLPPVPSPPYSPYVDPPFVFRTETPTPILVEKPSPSNWLFIIVIAVSLCLASTAATAFWWWWKYRRRRDDDDDDSDGDGGYDGPSNWIFVGPGTAAYLPQTLPSEESNTGEAVEEDEENDEDEDESDEEDSGSAV
eukprot:TRINITY_DN2594_c0_g1_i2.p1 TRINITY_DN2594_c0_g1~~TRINITY_DN2594_c0_g1_i2.p1  ORF type:complete len:2698 (-),score=320.22 TRINITY_DN2594_c0_g1_i2:83-8149(-)